jgi:hypothetical protein
MPRRACVRVRASSRYLFQTGKNECHGLPMRTKGKETEAVMGHWVGNQLGRTTRPDRVVTCLRGCVAPRPRRSPEGG